jgi:hypothetical protein
LKVNEKVVCCDKFRWYNNVEQCFPIEVPRRENKGSARKFNYNIKIVV